MLSAYKKHAELEVTSGNNVFKICKYKEEQVKMASHGLPPSFVTVYYVLSRFVAFTPFYYGLLGFSYAP